MGLTSNQHALARRKSPYNAIHTGVIEIASRVLIILGVAVALLRFTSTIGEVNFLSYSFIGVLALHMLMLWGRKCSRELSETAATAVLFIIVYLVSGHNICPEPYYKAIALLSLAGAASMIVNVARLVWYEDRKRIPYLIPGVVLIVFTLFLPWMLERQNRVSYDYWLYAFDHHLGFDPSFVMGRLFVHLPALEFICHQAYLALPVAPMLIYGMQLRHRVVTSSNLVLAFACSGVVNSILMGLLPAAGPVYAFSSFPAAAPELSKDSFAPITMCQTFNTIPSGHMAWAILLFWASRGCGRVARTIALLFLLLTAMATLGLGEHYLIDLVVAVPLALAVEALCCRPVRWLAKIRAIAILLSFGTILSWLFFLRHLLFLNMPSWLCWILIALTIFPCWRFESWVTRKFLLTH